MKFTGIVQKTLGRGRKLGFPTANIEAPEELENGIYIGKANGNPALVFVGANETFGEVDRKAEVYILDFNEDLYGKELEVEILKRIRSVVKFATTEGLIEQMKQDEMDAREYFKLG